MMVVNVVDDRGEQLKENNYDIIFLNGSNYDKKKLPDGFIVDKQMNSNTNRIVFILTQANLI